MGKWGLNQVVPLSEGDSVLLRIVSTRSPGQCASV